MYEVYNSANTQPAWTIARGPVPSRYASSNPIETQVANQIDFPVCIELYFKLASIVSIALVHSKW